MGGGAAESKLGTTVWDIRHFRCDLDCKGSGLWFWRNVIYYAGDRAVKTPIHIQAVADNKSSGRTTPKAALILLYLMKSAILFHLKHIYIYIHLSRPSEV